MVCPWDLSKTSLHDSFPLQPTTVVSIDPSVTNDYSPSGLDYNGYYKRTELDANPFHFYGFKFKYVNF